MRVLFTRSKVVGAILLTVLVAGIGAGSGGSTFISPVYTAGIIRTGVAGAVELNIDG